MLMTAVTRHARITTQPDMSQTIFHQTTYRIIAQTIPGCIQIFNLILFRRQNGKAIHIADIHIAI